MSASSQNQVDRAAPDAGLRIWSCVNCRRRKVRCDRREPCANCVKNNVECHFPVTGRIPRRRREPAVWKSPTQKQAELLGRLRRLEAVVTEMTAQIEDGAEEHGVRAMIGHETSPTTATSSGASGSNAADLAVSLPRPSATTGGDLAMTSQATDEFGEEFGRLVIDKDGSLHAGNRFWSVFCDEVDNIFQAIQDVADFHGEPSDSIAPETWSDRGGSIRSHQSFVLGNGHGVGVLDDLNPLPSQMLFIWQTYVENVDPFIKVLHVPSMEKIIRGLRGKFSSLGPDMEALLFAVSLATITSLDEEEVTMNFNTSKAQLLARYRLGAEQALARAEFLVTKEIPVVQTFVIYLSVLPYLGAKQLVWPLTGLLLRIARSLGLHRDGSHITRMLSLTPFDAEMRRRLWWQICFIDSQTRDSRVPELSISETMFDTKIPADIDDMDLNSTIPDPRISKTKPTDMTLCLIRCEIWELTRALRFNPTNALEAHLQIFRAAQSKIENTLLHFLRLDNAFDSFIQTMVSLFFAKVELVIYHQRFRQSTVSAQDKTRASDQHVIDMVLTSALTIIEAVHALKTEPAWKKWRWQLQGYVPWHAMGIVLSQLCHRPWSPASERAWISVKRVFDALSDDARMEPLWRPLSGLVANAQICRGEGMARMTAEAGAAEGLEQWAEVDSRAFYSHDSSSGTTERLPDSVAESKNVAIEPGVTYPQPVLKQGSRLSTVQTLAGLNQGDVARPEAVANTSCLSVPWDPSGFYLQPASIDATTSSSMVGEEFAENGGISEQESYPIDPVPMDWQTWDEMAGMGSFWDLIEF